MIGLKFVTILYQLFFAKSKSKKPVHPADILREEELAENLRKARERQEIDVVRNLRIARAKLERHLILHPEFTYGEPQTKAVLVEYIEALWYRIYALDIDPHSESSYLEAEILQWRAGSRELPILRLKFLD